MAESSLSAAGAAAAASSFSSPSPPTSPSSASKKSGSIQRPQAMRRSLSVRFEAEEEEEQKPKIKSEEADNNSPMANQSERKPRHTNGGSSSIAPPTFTPSPSPPPSSSRPGSPSSVKLEGDDKVASASTSASSSSVRSPASRSPSPSSAKRRLRDSASSASPSKEYKLTQVATATPSRKKKGHSIPVAPPQLIDHLPIANDEALATFTRLDENWYAHRNIGRSQAHEQGLVCECNYRPEKDDPSRACTDEAGCINRLTQFECLSSDCRCGSYCRNQRFQKKEYADVEIVKTEKKGFGLRARQLIPAETFVYEYIGEVVEPDDFHERMRRYHDERIPHFYFMMLQKDEYLDATKKGGIARFINHSCNPNCYVAKWHVGKHMRMGIFSQRDILQGEELTFNYNVDRYGNEAQPCYCGEPNCVGQLGGKTQTDIGGMSHLYIKALGIVDEVDRLQARGTKKIKSRILDEDFKPTLHPLEEDEVPIVATAIRQAASNRSVLTKLLERIDMTSAILIHKRFVRLHGFVLMAGVLNEWKDDKEVILSCMRILAKWPLIARNKVVDTGVLDLVGGLRKSEDEEIASLSRELYDAWQDLTMEFRIARKEGVPDETAETASIAGPHASGLSEENGDDELMLHRNRRRLADDDDSHETIQERMDSALDRAQAPADVSSRLSRRVPRPLGVFNGVPAGPGTSGSRGGVGSGWGGPPSGPRGGGRHLASAVVPSGTPGTPRTPDESVRRQHLQSLATSSPSVSTGTAVDLQTSAASTSKPTVSIEEIIRRANETQAAERQRAEEEAAASAARLASSANGDGASVVVKVGKGKHRSSTVDDKSAKKRKSHHSLSNGHGHGNGNGHHNSSNSGSGHASASSLNGTASKSISTPTTPLKTQAHALKHLSTLVSEVIVPLMSREYKSILTDRDSFKKHAKELTRVIVEKEEKKWEAKRLAKRKQVEAVQAASAMGSRPTESTEPNLSMDEGDEAFLKIDRLSTEKKDKIKSYAREYLDKLVKRKGLNPASSNTSSVVGGMGGGGGGEGSGSASASGTPGTENAGALASVRTPMSQG